MRYSIQQRTNRGDMFSLDTGDVFEVIDENGRVVRSYSDTEANTGSTSGSGGWRTVNNALRVELTADGRSVRLIRGDQVTIDPLP